MAMFPKHIKPTLSFTCSYCDFKDSSFKVSELVVIVDFYILLLVCAYCAVHVCLCTTMVVSERLGAFVGVSP